MPQGLSSSGAAHPVERLGRVGHGGPEDAACGAATDAVHDDCLAKHGTAHQVLQQLERLVDVTWRQGRAASLNLGRSPQRCSSQELDRFENKLQVPLGHRTSSRACEHTRSTGRFAMALHASDSVPHHCQTATQLAT